MSDVALTRYQVWLLQRLRDGALVTDRSRLMTYFVRLTTESGSSTVQRHSLIPLRVGMSFLEEHGYVLWHNGFMALTDKGTAAANAEADLPVPDSVADVWR